MSERFPFTLMITQTKEKTMIDLTGTHEENMAAIDSAPISNGFKAHVRKELREHFDSMDYVPDYISGWGV